MTPEQAQAMLVADFEEMFGVTVGSKCRVCPGFMECSILSAITGKHLVSKDK
jgi:hypothetical protein